MLFVILPPLAFALLLGIFLRARSMHWQQAFLYAAVTCGAIVFLCNEILSIDRMLTAGNVAKVWAMACAVLVVALISQSRRLSHAGEPGVAPAGVRRFFASVMRVSLLVPLGLILLTLLMMGIVAATNNWDSQTYHMARVENWIQYQSINHFPTNIGRQVFMPPFAEWQILHFQLLAGGDRFASFVQWYSLVGAAVAASFVARLLGAGGWGQLLAGVAVCTTPMAMLQSTSTQNDVVASFWVLATAALGMAVSEARKVRSKALDSSFTLRSSLTFWPLLAAGAALGFAALTKATTYLYLAPVGLFLTIVACRRLGVWRTALIIPCIVGLAIAINAPHFSRNYVTCGNVLGPQKEDPSHPSNWSYRNEIKNPNTLLSNISRNLSNQFSPIDFALLTRVPWIDQQIVEFLSEHDLFVDAAVRRERLQKWVIDFHTWLGADPSDPRTGWTGTAYQAHPNWNCEDHAGNALHISLLGIAAVALPFPHWRRRALAVGLLGAVLLGFLLFCWELRWQIWHARLTLPLVLLGAPLVGAAIELAGTRIAAIGISILLMLTSIPYLMNNRERPMFVSEEIVQKDGSIQQVWLGQGSIFIRDEWAGRFQHLGGNDKHFRRAVRDWAKAGKYRIGLVTPFDAWEYPLWLLLRETGEPFEIQHVEVVNETRSLCQSDPFVDFKPDVIIRLTGEIPVEVVAGR